MVDKINGVGQTSGHAQPNKGVKLSELQKVNTKLYEYFKAQNMKDDSYVTLSDLEQLVSYTDKNRNGKISVREAKKFGFEGSRKEIKSMLLSMDTVKDKINKSDDYMVKNENGSTDFYQGDVRVKTEFNEKDYKYTVLYGKDGKTPKETYEEEVKNGETVKTKTVYHQGNKNYAEVETDKEKIFRLYNPSNDQHLTRVVKELKSDPNSKETIEYTHGAGLSYTAKHTYTGQYVQDGVTENTVTFGEDGKEVSHKTNFDQKEEALKAANQEKVLQEVMEEEQDAVQANPQKFRVPEGWSVSDIARAFGISRDEVLEANINENGEKAFRTSKKGVEYFLIDQEINLPEGAEFNKDYKPKPRAKSQGHSSGLSEADIIELSSKSAINAANSTVEASKHAKLTPRAGLGKGKPLQTLDTKIEMIKKRNPNAEITYDEQNDKYTLEIKSKNKNEKHKIIEGSYKDMIEYASLYNLRDIYPNAELYILGGSDDMYSISKFNNKYCDFDGTYDEVSKELERLSKK